LVGRFLGRLGRSVPRHEGALREGGGREERNGG
jgi:hypothetical protein